MSRSYTTPKELRLFHWRYYDNEDEFNRDLEHWKTTPFAPTPTDRPKYSDFPEQYRNFSVSGVVYEVRVDHALYREAMEKWRSQPHVIAYHQWNFACFFARRSKGAFTYSDYRKKIDGAAPFKDDSFRRKRLRTQENRKLRAKHRMEIHYGLTKQDGDVILHPYRKVRGYWD